MDEPQYELIGGPLDGATRIAGTIVGFPDGTVTARIPRHRPGYFLLYRGDLSFCGRPSRLYFVGYMPVGLDPSYKRHDNASHNS